MMKCIFKEPIKFRTVAHKINSTWHIPYSDEYNRNQNDTFEIPKSWLCFSIK